MAKGYWVGHIDVQDPENYQTYVAAATAAIKAHGGHFLVRGGQYTCVEGAGPSRHTVLEFASYELALACYHSAAYTAAKALRLPYSQANMTIVEGLD